MEALLLKIVDIMEYKGTVTPHRAGNYIFDAFHEARICSVSAIELVKLLSPQKWQLRSIFDRTDCLIHLTGSVAEKVSLCTHQKSFIYELDIMITVGKADTNMELQNSADHGFNYILNKSLPASACPVLTGGKLDGRKMMKHFRSVLSSVMKSNDSVEISLSSEDDDNSPAVTLLLHFKSCDRKLLIDIVPSIEIQENVQLEINNVEFKNRVNDLANMKTYVVPKYKSDPLQWRVSYSLHERCIMSNFNFNDVVLHTLIDLKLEKQDTDLSEHKGLKSYHLKTALLHALSQADSLDISKKLLRRDCLDILINAYLKGYLPSFFDNRVNLIDSSKKECQEIEMKLIVRRNHSTYSFRRRTVDSNFQSLKEKKFLKIIPPAPDQNSFDNFNISECSLLPMISLTGNYAAVEYFLNRGNDINESGINGITGLAAAVISENVAMVQLFVHYGADIGHDLSDNDTALHLACHEGYADIVKILCKETSVINRENDLGHTPTSLTCARGFSDILEILISLGADVNKISSIGSTPLLMACSHGKIKIVKILIQNGAQVNLFPQNGSITPLCCACLKGFVDIVEILIENGALVNLAGKAGLTPLHVACMTCNVDVVKYIIAHGADIYAEKGKMYPSPFIMACANFSSKIVEIFFQHDVTLCDRSHDMTRALQSACEAGQYEIVNVLFNHGADKFVNVTNNKNNVTCLMAAINNGYYEIAKSLIQHGAFLDHADVNGDTALFNASQNGHFKIVKLLLNHGADIEKARCGGATALHIAAQNGCVDVVRILVNRGADVNHATHEGKTALLCAVQHGHIEIVEILLKHGSNVNQAPKHTSPLSVALFSGHVHIAQLLLEHCAEVNAPGAPLATASQQGYMNIMKTLIEHGADPNQSDRHGFTALIFASQEGHSDIVDFLIQNGADVNQADNIGDTPVLVASINNHLSIVKLLTKHGANVNVANEKGFTPLFTGEPYTEGRDDIVEFLLANGAVFNSLRLTKTVTDAKTRLSRMRLACYAENREQWFPTISSRFQESDTMQQVSEDLACTKLQFSKLKILWHKLAKDLHLLLASGCGDIDMVETFVKYGSDVNIVGAHGVTPLHAALQNKHVEIVKLLIENDADLNVEKHDGTTPLLFTCIHNYSELFKLLVQSGASVNEVNRHGVIPLIVAIQHKLIEYVRILIDNGADVNLAGEDGRTPLYVAVDSRCSEVVELLIKRGSNVNMSIRKCNGDTPLLLATKNGYVDIVKILISTKDENNKFTQQFLRNDVDFSQRDDAGLSPLLVAFYKRDITLFKIFFWYQMLQVKFILKILFCNACWIGDRENVDNLIKLGIDVNSTDLYGPSALLETCKCGHCDIVKILIQNGADVNYTSNGISALLNACSYGHYDIARILIQNGADVNYISKYGNSALLKACQFGNFDVARILIESGADVNYTNEYGISALLIACTYGHFDIARILVQNGADVDQTDSAGNSSIFHAVRKQDVDFVKFLIDNGASTCNQRKSGKSLLVYACSERYVGVVELLLKNGTDVNITNNDDGITPLSAAILNGHADIVSILLEHGARIDIPDIFGRTPLNYAMIVEENTEIRRIMRQHIQSTK